MHWKVGLSKMNSLVGIRNSDKYILYICLGAQKTEQERKDRDKEEKEEVTIISAQSN